MQSLEEGCVPLENSQCHTDIQEGQQKSASELQTCQSYQPIVEGDGIYYQGSIVEHLDNHSLILDSQHGFRKGRSCTTNLLKFLDKVTAAVDKGEGVDVVFLNLAKAFDKVPVMIVCLFALMIVLLIYCVLSIFVILINIILVMSDVDCCYYLYSLYVATLCIERDT